MAVDFGQDCFVGNTVLSANYTCIETANPSGQTCDIDEIDIHAEAQAIDDCHLGAFADCGANQYQSDGVYTGAGCDCAANTCETWEAGIDFTAFEIESGQYIGFYCISGKGMVEATTTGGGLAYVSGEKLSGTCDSYAVLVWKASIGGRCASGEPPSGVGPEKFSPQMNQPLIYSKKYWIFGFGYVGASFIKRDFNIIRKVIKLLRELNK